MSAVSSLIGLNDPKLFRERAFIDGEWVGSERQIAVTNPASDDTQRRAPRRGAALQVHGWRCRCCS